MLLGVNIDQNMDIRGTVAAETPMCFPRVFYFRKEYQRTIAHAQFSVYHQLVHSRPRLLQGYKLQFGPPSFLK